MTGTQWAGILRGEKKKNSTLQESLVKCLTLVVTVQPFKWALISVPFPWDNPHQGLVLLLLIDIPTMGDIAVPVRYHHSLNVNKMLADTGEASASIPIKEDPWLVAVNVSQDRAEEICVQATSIDLLQKENAAECESAEDRKLNHKHKSSEFSEKFESCLHKICLEDG